MQFTNRVFLPDNKKIYVSDDVAGDIRLEELFKQYGDVRVEVCKKELGKSLDELRPVIVGTISSVYN